MKVYGKSLFGFGLICVVFAGPVFSQIIPDDANHLPTKIGGEPKGNNRVDSFMVSGKIRLEGLAVGQNKPTIYVAAYQNGRLAARRLVAENGSFMLNDVPRRDSTLVVEINNAEVASRFLNYTPAAIVYQDFTINLTQFLNLQSKPGVISATAYDRSAENQERLDKAMTEIGKGNNDQAISLLKALVAKDARDFYAWTQLGNAYFLKKNAKEAEGAYLRSLTENPSSTLGRINLGKLYLSERENDKAIEVLSKAVEVDPASPDAQHYLGEAYLAIKKGSKAVPYLEEAIRLAPMEKSAIHLRLAALYNGAGLKQRASAEYKTFLEKNPTYEKSDELRKYITENPQQQ